MCKRSRSEGVAAQLRQVFLAELGKVVFFTIAGIDELFQLHTPDLAFVPLKPAVTFSCLVAWKKYQLLSPACEAFLKGLKEEIHWQGKD